MRTNVKVILLNVLGKGTAATTAMTIFSFLSSYTVAEHFKEPQLLNHLFHKKIREGKKKASLRGYWLHYLVGWIFAGVYEFFWKQLIRHPSTWNGLLFGFLGGLIGIVAWSITLSVHPDPPKTNIKPYFLHLLVAHLIFGVVLVKSDNPLLNTQNHTE